MDNGSIMSDILQTPSRTRFDAGGLLRGAGLAWFLVAAAGQWTFVWYILNVYGVTTAAGNPQDWNETGLMVGYVDGDWFGNLMFGVHVLLAAVITMGGTLQLVPVLRKRLPALHRWNGRIFMVIAVVLAVGGLWMTWLREARLSDLGALGVSLNGILILIAAPIALHLAMKRRIDQHRRWAMRLFILVNGVWFFRIGFMAWIIIMQGPVGSTRQLDGPFDLTLAFACYLLPLAVLELYFRAGRAQSAAPKLAVAGLVLLLTLVTAVGIFGAWMFMWSPHL